MMQPSCPSTVAATGSLCTNAHSVLEFVRSARVEDAPTLARLHREARAAAMPNLPVVHTPEEDTAFFAGEVLGTCNVSIIEDQGQPVAFMATRDTWIEHLYVAPSHWRRGYGQRLIRFAQAMQDGLQLWTFQQNTGARAFYAAHGFTEVELTDGEDNEEKAPDVRLVWRATD